MREIIFNALKSLYPVYFIGEHKGECKEPYIVIKFDSQIQSFKNNNCFWKVVSIFIYTPLHDISKLDFMEEEVIKILKPLLEFNNEIGPEVLEEKLKAYSKRITFRIPKGGS